MIFDIPSLAGYLTSFTRMAAHTELQGKGVKREVACCIAVFSVEDGDEHLCRIVLNVEEGEKKKKKGGGGRVA